jgi:hypothetical protein
MNFSSQSKIKLACVTILVAVTTFACSSDSTGSGFSLRVGNKYVYTAGNFGVSYVAKSGGEVKTLNKGVLSDGMPMNVKAIDLAIDGETMFALTEFGVQWARVGDASFQALHKTLTLSGLDPSSGNNGIATTATHVFWTGDAGEYDANGMDTPRGQVYRIARCK